MTKSKRTTQTSKSPSKAPEKSASGAKPATAEKSPATAAKPAATPTTAAKTATDDTKKTVPIGVQPVASAKDKAPAKGMETVKSKEIGVNEPEDTDLRQGDLVKAVAERANVRNNLARDVVMATLEELGLAVRSNREMKLPGLGRVKYQRVKQNVSSIVTVAKIRQDKDD